MDIKESVKSALARIDADPNIPEKNKEAVHDLVNNLRAKGRSEKTVYKHLYLLRFFLTHLGNIKIGDATKKDIERVLGDMNSTKFSDYTKYHFKVTIKLLYKELLGEGYYYPKAIAWLKTGMGKKAKMLPEDILSEDEVLKMIETANSARDKAIIALLFDSGIRIGELLSMRKKDIELNTEPAHITVKGKTGMRRIPILFSVPYLAQYLNQMKNNDGGDHFWWNLAQSHVKGEMDEAGIRKMLKRVGDESGIRKRIYPHLFRHSRASYYANKMTEQQLKAYFGWAGDSKMAATYVHLSGRDIDNALLQIHGIKPSEDSGKPKLTVKTCPRCRASNPMDSSYCTRCGSALDIATALMQEKYMNKMKDEVEESIIDDKHMEDIAHRYFMRKRKERKGRRY